MTGVDAPCCSTIYLDKPMRNHTLMQTIARANRVFQDKVNGLIVDYVGVFRNLQQALAIYGSGAGGRAKPGETPITPKDELIRLLEQAVASATTFCAERSVDLGRLQEADGFQLVRQLDDAVEALLETDETKRRYLSLAADAQRLYKAVLPDPAANQWEHIVRLLDVLAEKIRALSPTADISDVMEAVEQLLDDSIAAEGYVIREGAGEYGDGRRVDLSQIDFEALRKRFDEGRRRTEFEKLRAAVERTLRTLVRLNRSRLDYAERFQQMIDEYNAATANVEEWFNRLVVFAQELTQEQQRGVAEGLSEEELAVFDILTRPEMHLTSAEERQVKKAARDLLEALKREKLVLDWRKRQESRAGVQVAIHDVLDRELPEKYEKPVYDAKCAAVFQHVYESYYGAGGSVYAGA
jgi:type I restriction enzyme R subunit